MSVDTSSIKIMDVVHSRGVVVKIDRAKIDGLPFAVLHDGCTEAAFLSAESIVMIEPTKPTTPAEFRELPLDDQNRLLERWIKNAKSNDPSISAK